MPSASDYPAMPGAGSLVYTSKELDAELVLAPIAARLVLSLRPATPVIQLVTLASLAWTGHWARGHLVPHGWDLPTACLGLLFLVFVVPAMMQAPGGEGPDWAHAAAVHEESLPGRVPAPVYQQVKAVMGRMTASSRWRSAQLYVARCTDDRPVHWGQCCTGGTYPRQGRLLVILGEHLMHGPPEVAVAVLAHERRHVLPLNTYLYSLPRSQAHSAWCSPGGQPRGPCCSRLRSPSATGRWQCCGRSRSPATSARHARRAPGRRPRP